MIFGQRADVVYPSTGEPRKVKPGRTRRHDVDRVELRFYTTNGCIMKGQTGLADVINFTDDFGLTAEKLDSIFPDALPSTLSSLSFQRFLLSFQPDRYADGEGPRMSGVDAVKTAVAVFY